MLKRTGNIIAKALQKFDIFAPSQSMMHSSTELRMAHIMNFEKSISCQ